jgi:hypothetical protein
LIILILLVAALAAFRALNRRSTLDRSTVTLDRENLDESRYDPSPDGSGGALVATCGTVCEAGEAYPLPRSMSNDIPGFADRSKVWPIGSELKVLMRDRFDDKRLAAMLARGIRAWEPYVNLRLVLIPGDQAGPGERLSCEIRVTFQGRPGDYHSAIGTDSLYHQCDDGAQGPGPRSDHSIMLGGLTGRSNPELVLRHVTHEFGHALGFRHEHQNPNGNIPWNRHAVYRHYKRLGWSEAKVNANIFEVLDRNDRRVFATPFDPESVMCYHIPRELTLNGRFAVPWNLTLSPGDREAARRLYPAWLSRKLGVSVRIAPGTAERGVLVVAIQQNSPFSYLRLERPSGSNRHLVPETGDQVTHLNGTDILTVSDFARACAATAGEFRVNVMDQKTGRVFSAIGLARETAEDFSDLVGS